MKLEKLITTPLKKGKHDNIVRQLRDRLKGEVYTGLRYFHESYGEADLINVRGKYILNFEVKSNDSIKSRRKALQQLERTEKLIKHHLPEYRLFNFYVYGTKEDYKIEWIRQ